MAKFLLGIVIVAFTSFCGYFFAKKYRQKKLFFQQFEQFNERFISEISYARRPVREFISKYDYQGEFGVLLHNFFMDLDERSKEDRVWVDETVYSFLTKEERRFAEDYFLMIGKGDSQSQKSYFSAQKDSLKKMRICADETAKKYGDLYIKLGFLCGLLILILII